MALEWVHGTVVALAGFAVLVRPARAPYLVAAALVAAVVPLGRAWRASRGTALRAAVVWGGIALGLALVSQVVAAREPMHTGRLLTGLWVYLTTLAALAGLISVLNARTPGGGAWALLMALLVLVFFIPVLEPAGFRLSDDPLALRLRAPWNLFFGVLVVTGVTNFLPTRYGLAAAVLALGFGFEYGGLTWWSPAAPEWLATVVLVLPWSLAAALWCADRTARQYRPPDSRFERVWLAFRDHWGVVWALRVHERFNRTADQQDWSFRLQWQGLVARSGTSSCPPPEDAEATLVGLLRRFAEPAWFERAALGQSGPACGRSGSK